MSAVVELMGQTEEALQQGDKTTLGILTDIQGNQCSSTALDKVNYQVFMIVTGAIFSAEA